MKNKKIEWKIFQGCLKIKKEKKNIMRLSFVTQFKIEFLLLFNGCRKVLGKIPPLFNDPDVLSSVSDKAKLFARHFFKN